MTGVGKFIYPSTCKRQPTNRQLATKSCSPWIDYRFVPAKSITWLPFEVSLPSLLHQKHGLDRNKGPPNLFLIHLCQNAPLLSNASDQNSLYIPCLFVSPKRFCPNPEKLEKVEQHAFVVSYNRSPLSSIPAAFFQSHFGWSITSFMRSTFEPNSISTFERLFLPCMN